MQLKGSRKSSIEPVSRSIRPFQSPETSQGPFESQSGISPRAEVIESELVAQGLETIKPDLAPRRDVSGALTSRPGGSRNPDEITSVARSRATRKFRLQYPPRLLPPPRNSVSRERKNRTMDCRSFLAGL